MNRGGYNKRGRGNKSNRGYRGRMACINSLDVDILGIGETHLINSNSINIKGYKWYGHNRKNIHIRAKCGSGGVGFLIRQEIVDVFNIEIVNDVTDGILWVKLQDKLCLSNIFYVCAVYLPPENSTRAVNVHDFMETLMTHIYTIPNGHAFYICGDWNSRCSDFSDFIEGVDQLPERNIVDFQHNSYGSVFCDFLIDVNCCILNGRNSLHNDYTFISTRGSSVVDYCVLPYEQLKSFSDFTVHRTTELIKNIGMVDKFDLRRIVPDHSVLTWSMSLNFNFVDNISLNDHEPVRKVKYSADNIPQDWLCDPTIITSIDNIISYLEHSETTQFAIDDMYDSFVTVMKSEMSQKLPCKTVLYNSNNNKPRRCQKPWWTDNLGTLWNDVCKAEKVWTKCKGNTSKNLRHLYVEKRKLFDKSVQKAKRQYWFSSQEELMNTASNPKEFWRKIGKIGVGNERQNNIPMEVKLSDGSLCNNQNVVIDTWKNSFCDMLNQNHSSISLNSNQVIFDEFLDNVISIDEVYKVLNFV
ncbi:Hypothetical predicted protein [Mytilus galloprovincialis]|uniref:Endonuclease/exonuclease/phosphatase domain-containing protein n=1 Tax=Mytilus galloprovincialis TaxID=29158 RepID=A0A8B6BHP9_MYTGA|nr:Hypothetical predicted protein [Mytilus galloprovincialis]